MRVTNNMIADQSLFNVRRSLSDFLRIQDEMSTGRRVSKPSDDPIGIQRSVRYRTEIARLEQIQTNISLGTNLLSTYESNMSELNNIASQMMEIAVAVANETNDSRDIRPAYLDEVKSAIERVINLVEAELDGRYVFSGFRTDRLPLDVGASGVRYLGDRGALVTEISRTEALDVSLNAGEVLLKQFEAPGAYADLRVGVDSLTLLSELRDGAGIDLNTFTVTDNNLGISVGIDLNIPVAPTTLGTALSNINSQLASAGLTDITAEVGSDNNVVLRSNSSGLISATTPLNNLNGGVGVDQQPGLIRVYDSAGTIEFNIDISSASTVGDALSAINSALSAAGISNVSASINAGSTGIDITDSNGVPLDLHFGNSSIEEITVNQLGLVGNVAPILFGEDLNPVSDFTVSEGAGQTAADLGILGSFGFDQAGPDLDAILTGATPLSRLNNNAGFTLGSIQMTQGIDTRVVDLNDPAIVTVADMIAAISSAGLNVTASINSAKTGIQIVNNSIDDSFLVENYGSETTASDLGIYGASDFIGSLYLFRNELQNSSQESINKDDMEVIMTTLKSSLDSLLGVRGNIGSRQRRLDTTALQITTGELELVRLLSEIEDSDIAELVTRLATHENNYKAGLIAMAKIIQPSLMDFLR